MSSPHVCFAEAPQYSDELEKAKLDTYDRMLQRHRQQQQQQQQQQKNSDEDTVVVLDATKTARNTYSNDSSPIPRYERNMGFFQQLSRRFGFKANDDLFKVTIESAASIDDDANSSSTDSYSSATNNMSGNAATTNSISKLDHSMEHISNTSSATSSTNDINEVMHHQQQQRGRVIKSNENQSKPRRSTSSLRRAFESLTLSTRSLSCSGSSPPPPPQAARYYEQQQMPIKSALKSTSNMELNKHRSNSMTNSSNTALANGKQSNTKSAKVKPPPQRILRQPVSYTYLKGISGLPTQRVPRSSVCCQYARR